MRQFGFDNENGTSFSHGLRFLEFPEIKYGSEIIKTVQIYGRKEQLIERTGMYTDTVITNKLEFNSRDPLDYQKKIRSIRQWILSTRKLTYTDMEDSYFLVKKTEISDETRMYGIYGVITVVFTCSPSLFLHEGDYEIKLSSGKHELFNAYSMAQPLYQIFGNGTCVLTINGKQVNVDVKGSVTLDTELMIAYTADVMKNASVTGEYKNMVLNPGENTIFISPGFSVDITPKWRILDDSDIQAWEYGI